MIHFIGIVCHGGKILGEEYNRSRMELVLNTRAHTSTRHGSKRDQLIVEQLLSVEAVRDPSLRPRVSQVKLFLATTRPANNTHS